MESRPDDMEILDSMEQGVLIVDRRGKIEIFNASLEKMSGFSRESVIGRPLTEVFAREEWLGQLYERSIDHERSLTIHDQNLTNQEGKSIPVSVTISPLWVQRDRIRGTIIVFHDLSTIKAVQENLLRSDRLAYLGLVASGLAHEIKNPLAAIRGAAQLLAKDLDSQQESTRCCQLIVEETDRMNRLLQELLSLGNPRTIEPRPVNVNRLLDESITLESKSSTNREVEFVKLFDPSLPEVLGDPERLKQVFINLIHNALDAMNRKGKIEIRSKFVTDSMKTIIKDKKSRSIVIEIKDDGPGFSLEEQEKIFIPFYTTKPKGTGLGLPLSLQIVKEHHGTMKVDSTPGEGTSFKVILPAAEVPT